MERALAEASDVTELKSLNDKAAAVAELARRMEVALDEQNRLAEFRIRVARKLGMLLAETVKRGGVTSNLHDVSSKKGGSSAPLPPGITHVQSFRLQKLAKVSDDEVAAYIAHATKRGKAVTVAGLMRSVGATNNRSSSRKRRATAGTIPPLVKDAINRLMKVDAIIGMRSPNTKGKTPRADELLKGKLVVDARQEPVAWLERLAEARARSRIDEAVALLPTNALDLWVGAGRGWRVGAQCHCGEELDGGVSR